MEWRKLKTIVLLILLAMDLALIPLVLGPQITDHYHSTRADREAELFLEQRGIDLGGLALPDPRDLDPLLAGRDRAAEGESARALLGEQAEETARGGGVYRYEGTKGSVQFHSDGSFVVRLDPAQFPLKGDGAAAALDVMAALGFSGEVIRQEDNALTLCQTMNGARLFSQQVVVSWDESGVLGVESGRRVYGQPETDPGRETVTLSTALINFYNGLNRMGDVCSRVDSIVPGYVSSADLNQRLSLTPVWRVTTDTGSYQLDLVSGELTRLA